MTSARRRGLGALGALLAVAVFVAMAVTGKTPGTKRHVPFEPAGLMPDPPEQISRVELTMDGRRVTFHRAAGGGWTVEHAGPIPAALVSRLGMAIRFMHVSAPIRVMARDEYDNNQFAEFGLDPPRYAVALFAGGETVLNAAFGSPNPIGVAQYVRVEGREKIYLLPSFVGREWEMVADGVPVPAGR